MTMLSCLFSYKDRVPAGDYKGDYVAYMEGIGLLTKSLQSLSPVCTTEDFFQSNANPFPSLNQGVKEKRRQTHRFQGKGIITICI